MWRHAPAGCHRVAPLDVVLADVDAVAGMRGPAGALGGQLEDGGGVLLHPDDGAEDQELPLEEPVDPGLLQVGAHRCGGLGSGVGDDAEVDAFSASPSSTSGTNG